VGLERKEGLCGNSRRCWWRKVHRSFVAARIINARGREGERREHDLCFTYSFHTHVVADDLTKKV